MEKPIALAIDFKKFTPSIIKTGVYLAKNIYPSSPLVFFHIIEQFFTPPAYLLPYLNVEKERLEKKLDELIEPLKEYNLKIEKKVILGDFWTALKHFLEELSPEVVILGYEPHIFKVSTAEKILERMEVSFLVVKEKPLEKVERILCPFDFSEKALSALQKAFFIAQRTQADLKVFYVITPLEIGNQACNRQYLSEKEKEIEEKWEDLILKLKPEGVRLSFEILCGNRLDEIIKKMETEKPDLVILGRRGKVLTTGLGSVSKALIRVSQIPLYLVN